jgi:hypothetical protein
MTRQPRQTRTEYGDWQTPPDLARAVLALVAAEAPETVLEPSCGRGAFLEAAAERFPGARLHGYEINPEYVDAARARLSSAGGVEIRVADFFETDWARVLSGYSPGRVLVTGNPPWVTSAGLGVLGSSNHPEKRNFKRLRGYDALTGKSNFDVSEWMLLSVLEALKGREATLAVICKSAVARRVIEFAWEKKWPLSPGGLFRIDAMHHFGAAVDAVVFVARTAASFDPDQAWDVHTGLAGEGILSRLGVVDGVAVPDLDTFARTQHLAGDSECQWRSGVKHDCARVMELTAAEGRWVNGFGDSVDIEEDVLFPLLKSSDVANGRTVPTRRMIVTQRALGEETAPLAARAPRAWAYLEKHAALLGARRSSIYLRRPPFSIFGIGSYSFSPWKVAVSGLYKRYGFVVVGPSEGRPVLLDDTCYFLPFSDEESARQALAALLSPAARDFYSARVFWDSKRPLSKALLQTLRLEAVSALSLSDKRSEVDRDRGA